MPSADITESAKTLHVLLRRVHVEKLHARHAARSAAERAIRRADDRPAWHRRRLTHRRPRRDVTDQLISIGRSVERARQSISTTPKTPSTTGEIHGAMSGVEHAPERRRARHVDQHVVRKDDDEADGEAGELAVFAIADAEARAPRAPGHSTPPESSTCPESSARRDRPPGSPGFSRRRSSGAAPQSSSPGAFRVGGLRKHRSARRALTLGLSNWFAS